MPIKRSFSAVEKKRALASAHPKSRRAAQLQRSILRSEKLYSTGLAAIISKQQPVVEKLTWFQLHLAGDRPEPLERDEATALIREYIARHDDEIAGLRAGQRPGRPIPPRLSLLESIRTREEEELAAGQFETVDMLSARSLAALADWTGDYNAVPRLVMRTYKGEP